MEKINIRALFLLIAVCLCWNSSANGVVRVVTDNEKEIIVLFKELSKKRCKKYSNSRWSNPNCRYSPSIVSHNLPGYILLYNRIMNFYDSSSRKRCVYLFEEGNGWLEGLYLISEGEIKFDKIFLDRRNRKLERKIFKSYKKWIKRMNKYGLDYLIQNKISPLDGSGVIWKRR